MGKSDAKATDLRLLFRVKLKIGFNFIGFLIPAQKESQTGNRKTGHKLQTSAGIIRVQLKIGFNFIGFLIPHARDEK